MDVYFEVKDPANFGGVEKLRLRTGEPRKKIIDFLSRQEVYTKHRYRKLKFRRNQNYATTIDDSWHSDLIDVQKLSRHNGGIRYLLVLIDVLSRYLWIFPIKSKSGASVKEALEPLLSKRAPLNLFTDAGKEYLNKRVLNLFEKYKINHVTINSENKASLAERVNRTIKEKIYKYMNHHQTKKYLNILPTLVDTYNSTVHSTIGVPPKTVNINNESKIWKKLYGRTKFSEKSLFKLHDLVRVSIAKPTFSKGYTGYFSDEIFKIVQIIKRVPVVYKISDLSGEPVQGTFYKQQLVLVKPPLLGKDEYEIERVIKQKGSKILVKWKGYSKPSWIQAASVNIYQ